MTDEFHPRWDVPGTPRWDWLGARSEAELAAIGDPANQAPRWAVDALGWMRHRNAPPGSTCAPGHELFPVLTARSDSGGRLAFLHLSMDAVPATEAARRAAQAPQQAADWIAAVFRRLAPHLDHPRMVLQSTLPVAGTSAGLAGFVHMALRCLGIPHDHRLCATGAWNPDGPELHPVDAQTLDTKVTVAHRWGYRLMFVVEGQRAGSRPLHDGDQLHGVTLRFLPCDPVDALTRLAGCLDAGDESLARALAAFDSEKVRGAPRFDTPPAVVERITDPFLDISMSPLVRYFARDIRSRSQLHAGHTAAAEAERLAAADLSDAALDAASGWIYDYLEWHQPAHHAVIAIDLGHWDGDHPAHAHLERHVIRPLSGLPLRSKAPQTFAMLAARNTRARRLDFAGRWNRDPALLADAWNDVTALARHWPGIMAEAARLGLGDTTLRRQHNLCIEIAHSCAALGLPLPDTLPNHEFWPCSVDESGVDTIGSPFDLVAWLRHSAWSTARVTERAIDAALDSCDRWIADSGRPAGFPVCQIPETILTLGLGNPEQRQRAARMLAYSALFLAPDTPEAPPRLSILALLALRALRVLEEQRAVGLEFDLPRPAWVAPEGSRLAALVAELRSDPAGAVARCPY